MEEPEISVVVPVHNEEENIPRLVEGLREVLRGRHYEVVVVNDNSTDSTGRVAEEMGRRHGNIKVVHHRGERGVGRALREGLRASRGPIVVTMDGDLSHDPADLPHLLEALREADVVLGSRFAAGGRMDSGPLRILLSRSFSLLARILSGLPVRDLTTGYRVHRHRVLQALPLESTGFDIHLEIPLLAGYLGFRVVEAPIHYRRRYGGSSKLRYRRVWAPYLRTLLRLWWRYRVLRPPEATRG